MKSLQLWPVWVIGLLAATSLRGDNGESQQIVELEAFIVEETAQTQPETLSPLSVRMDSLFGDDLTVLEIPRAVTVLSPEMRELLQVDSYEALDRFGAGTQRLNFFGLAGSAFLRGTRAGTYFNGMLRAYQRNEMPMSFGALDGLEIIKGPVPANFSPTLVGGAVNQRPKSPFYDRARGSVELEFGSWDQRQLQIDYGAPLTLLGKPAAYRVSYTGHRSERFYENVPNDFDSLYGAVKIKLSDRNRLFLGGEIYDFRSSEIPGINRPTQQLIDSGRYVIGEPALLTSSTWDDEVVRPLVSFPYTYSVNPALFSLSVPGDVARQQIDPSLLSHMLDLNDMSVIEDIYQPLDINSVPGFAAWGHSTAVNYLSQVDKRVQDAYVYTPEYFEAGGRVLTNQLQRERVLADTGDLADSRDLIVFADLETRLDSDRRLMTRFFLEDLSTRKASTYGFAFNSDQLVMQGKVEYQAILDSIFSNISTGLDFRYTDAHVLQDFDAEPFSRRDLSRDTVSLNSIVRAGGSISPDGLNNWSSFSTASLHSELFQLAWYTDGVVEVGERIKLYYGGRAEHASYTVELPNEIDRVSEETRESRKQSGDEFLWQVHLNPHVEVAPEIYFYGALQLGKALAPGDGGTVSGTDSFTDAELFEGGLKANLMEGKLYTSLSAYHWDQATFSTRDASARPLRAKGLEWEFAYSPTERLTLLGAFTAQRVNLRTDVLGFGAIPQSEEGWALNGGILNATGGRSAPDNPDMVFAGMPEVTAHLYAAFKLPYGFQLSGGPIWRDGYAHDMQRAMRIPSYILWTAQLRYDADDWWIRLHVENLFDEEYWIGQEPVFSAGTLILQGSARRWQLTAGYQF
ncbi:MAG: TonB-dependent siderophore receptor [Puniceicoccaceae bacterium]